MRNSAQIGPVTILGESSVGSGVRRVEAYVGLDSFKHLAKERALMAGLASSLKVPSDEVPARVANLVERLRVAEKELDRMRLSTARAAAVNAAAGAELSVRSVSWRSGCLPRHTAGDLRSPRRRHPRQARLRTRRGRIDRRGRRRFGAVRGAVNAAAQDLGLSANDLVKALGQAVNGRGGGKAELAQGSGSGASGIDAALAALRAEVGRS